MNPNAPSSSSMNDATTAPSGQPADAAHTSPSSQPSRKHAQENAQNAARITPIRETVRQLLRTAHPHRRAFARSLWMMVGAAILNGLALACIIPLFVALLPPAGGVPDWHAASSWLVLISVLAVTMQALRWMSQSFDYDGQMADAIHHLRTRLGEQLRRMPLLKLQDKRTGEIHAVLLGNVDENLNYTTLICGMALNATLMPLTAALVTLYWDWRLGLALLVIFPAVIPLYRWRRPQNKRILKAYNDAHSRCNGDIMEYTQGLAVLRASRATGTHALQLQESLKTLENVQVSAQRSGIRANVVIASVLELGMMLIMAAGVTWVAQGSLSLAVLAAVTIMLVRIGEPLGTFINLTSIFELIETALGQIDRMMAIEPLPQQTPAQKPTRFDIRFDGITFGYDADRPLLKDFSATLPAHGMTALVGPSGGGKTTITRLLMRHADPQKGTVSIGEVDVRAIEPETLNRLVSVVFQDVYLFDDTVLANIRMARPEATDAEVHEAARAAQCLEFIGRLPQGWNTRIGEIGAKLSGGERQRISIARALLKDAPIVILDEPTAALDTESERAVQHAIGQLVKNRTVIVIAHRLSTIVGAQQILVIDEGKALEAGSHAALLAARGRYAGLWEAQGRAKRWRAGRD